MSGSLPPGLALDSVTGIISGKPTTSGVYPFGVAAWDGKDSAFAGLEITVYP